MNKDTLRFQHKKYKLLQFTTNVHEVEFGTILYTTVIEFFRFRVVSKMHTNIIKKLFYRAQLKQNQ